MVGLLVMSCATVLFAVAAYFKNKWAFYGVSLFARMVQGIADSLICVAIPSVIAIEFPNNSELYQGYLEMAMGIGLTLGPIMSSAVYKTLGYANTFYFFAAFITVFGFISVFFMPARLDKTV